MINIAKKVSGAFFLGVILLLSSAYADNPPGQHEGEIFRQLHLTDDQKAQLEANKKEHRAKMHEARQEIKTAMDAMRLELMKPQLDMARINDLHARIKALQSRMEDIKLSSILQVRAILTPEQFVQFLDLMHKHRPEPDK